MFFARDRMRFLGQTRSRGRAGASSRRENKYLNVQRRPVVVVVVVLSTIKEWKFRAPKRNFLSLGLSFAIQPIRLPLPLRRDTIEFAEKKQKHAFGRECPFVARSRRGMDAESVSFS